MRLPILTKAINKYKQKIMMFRRLNRLSIISDDEISDCENVSWKNAPALSLRPMRTNSYTLTTPKSLCASDLKLAWVDGTNFKYDNVTKGTVTAGLKSFSVLNERIIIFPDKKKYDFSTGTFSTMAAETPAILYACAHNNRIFGVFDSKIKVCTLGNEEDWDTFVPVASTNSYALDWDTEGGDFTGIVSYQNHVVIFKADYMYEVYNVNPPYNVQRVNKVGCLNNVSHCEVGQVLYFAGRDAIYAYSGGVPRPISEILNVSYTDSVLGGDDRYLYVNLKTGTSTWELFVYDTITGSWSKEDDIQVLQFTKLEGHCYGLLSTGALVKFNSGIETAVEWYFTTKEFDAGVFNKKGLNKVRLSLELEHDSNATLSIKFDDGAFTDVKTYGIEDRNNYVANIRIVPSDRVQLKLSGVGEFKFFGMQMEYRMGEDG